MCECSVEKSSALRLTPPRAVATPSRTMPLLPLDSLSLALRVTGACLVILFVYGYYQYKSVFSYWKKRGVKGPPPLPFVGNVQLSTDVLMTFVDWTHKYGKFNGHYIMGDPILTVADVESIKDILIRNFHKFSDQNVMVTAPLELESLTNQNGAQWKIDRSIMSPAFSSGKMKAMFHLMQESYKHLDREFERLASEGQDVDTKSVFSKLSTMVIARCAFATEVDAFNDQNSELLKMLHSLFKFSGANTIRIIFFLLMPKFVSRWIGFGFFPPEAMSYLGKMCDEILKQRRRKASEANEYQDLLHLLTEARVASDDCKNEVRFSDTKIIANAILFFIAGFETTSTLLFWASYALVMNPHLQERLHQQVKQAKESSGKLDYETLQSIKYLDAFINETLRMYPPIVQFIRQCTEEHTLPNGLTIEKGVSILVPTYYVHHDEANYPEPEKFDPERFMPENKDQIESAAFLAFAQGSRNCIGMRFALLEAKMALANLILKYQFEKSPRTPQKPTFDLKSFVLATKEMPIRVVKRSPVDTITDTCN